MCGGSKIWWCRCDRLQSKYLFVWVENDVLLLTPWSAVLCHSGLSSLRWLSTAGNMPAGSWGALTKCRLCPANEPLVKGYVSAEGSRFLHSVAKRHTVLILVQLQRRQSLHAASAT